MRFDRIDILSIDNGRVPSAAAVKAAVVVVGTGIGSSRRRAPSVLHRNRSLLLTRRHETDITP